MTQNEYDEWLSSLKEGSTYLNFCSNYSGSFLQKITITRRTPKCIFIKNNRFLLSKDKLPLPATQEQIAKVKLSKSINDIDFAFDNHKYKLTQEQADAILKILDCYKPSTGD